MRKIFLFFMFLFCGFFWVNSAASSSWITLGPTGKDDIIKLVPVDGKIYAQSTQNRVLRLEENEKNWTPVEKGLEIFREPEVIALSSDKNALYALVRTKDGKSGDVMRLSQDSWKGLGIPIKNPEFANGLLVTDGEIFIGKAPDSGDPPVKVLKNGDREKMINIPAMQDLAFMHGRIHSVYGLAGMPYYLNSNNQWEILGRKWSGGAVKDLIEVGRNIYATQNYYGLIALNPANNQWSQTQWPEECFYPTSPVAHGEKIYLKVTCKVDQKDEDKIFSYSTISKKWVEIQSPMTRAKLGPLFVKGSHLYLATQDGGFYKLSLR